MRHARPVLVPGLLRRRRGGPDPSLAELGFGLAAFVIIALAGLYLATVLGA